MRVVLGEGQPGSLRLVLEAQGFDVIGHARGDDELRLVLAVTRPAVVVLDAGISAAAALEARSLVDGIPFVAVWPTGVASVVAEERVPPEHVLQDLGDAVRRAARRGLGAEEPVRIPDVDETPPGRAVNDPEPPPSPRAPEAVVTGRRRLLVAAGAWLLSLTALATIGLAVPRAFDLIERERSPRPSIVERPSRALEERRDREARTTRRGERPVDPANGLACGRPEGAGVAEGGVPEDPGRGCGTGNRDEARGDGRPAGAGAKGNGPPEQPGDRRNEDPGTPPAPSGGSGTVRTPGRDS